MARLSIDHGQAESLKQMRRDLWDYKRVDRVPTVIWPTWAFGHSLHEQLDSKPAVGLGGTLMARRGALRSR
jgi:hypothetical protein